MWCKRRERDHIWRDITYLLGFICLVFISGVDGSCSGRTVFENTWTGHITEGPGNYPMDVYCEWRIVAPDPLAKIMLNFTNFKSECTYDFLFIYDGNSFTSELIASFSGDTTPEPVVAYSGHMIIYLYSDTNYALDGVDANFYIQNCTNDCNGKGTCKDYQCDCQRGWKGDACQFESCPGNCGYDENRGQCLFILY
uniref:Multiple epidermal growth factor-like domains protein 8-like n=1 Tax=Saccoglossus kowalevskii TaxID=10224 RepID=A0ABM0MPQ0_SACKO|nr:PREDICTED: multiple epidermal growth factor-like domains protein 8-like [Saccoglossus kowalevskii]